MQSSSHTRENRAAFCFGLTAHCNHIGEYVTRGLPDIEDGLCLTARNVDSSLLQCFYSQGIEYAGFQPSALGAEVITAQLVEQRRSDLAACTVLHTNEKDFLFHRPDFNRNRTQIEAIRGIVTRTSHCARQHHPNRRAFLELTFRLHAPAV
jgi:hypothetical protein